VLVRGFLDVERERLAVRVRVPDGQAAVRPLDEQQLTRR
jgi:hypothetical protein